MTSQTDKLESSEKHAAEIEVERTRPGRVFTPAVDIFEDEATITLIADMPGVGPDEIDIDLYDGVLTVNGGVAIEEHSEQIEVHREFETGTYHRQFRLSDQVDQSKIDARMVDGVLTLELPKVKAAEPLQISVKAG